MPAPPLREGVGASRVQVSPGDWLNALDFLVRRFPGIAAPVWRDRFDRGRVLDGNGLACAPESPVRVGDTLHYYREVEQEPGIPFAHAVLYRDAHLLVADKPHFLPVMPAGRWVRHCLLARLRVETGLDTLVPLHRIDRDTAGLVLFSLRPDSRAAYQALFAQRNIHKTYEALAPHRDGLPAVHRSRLERGEPFYRTREVDGPPNSETRIGIVERLGLLSRYRLIPMTGRKHQLRVHMAALGAPIVGDPLYPRYGTRDDDDFSQPMQLLARSLEFTDPVCGEVRRLESRLMLNTGPQPAP